MLRMTEAPPVEHPRVRAQIPAIFAELANPYRYKVCYGGRGGAKSWQFARLLVAQAHHTKQLILCTREFQNSINDSVHRVIRRQIQLLGLEQWFDVEKTSIRSRLTGSEFIFKGLQKNIQEIRSLEGVTRTWVEEAQSTSEESWVYLLPTVLREPDVELWVSFNPVDETDPTYQRFVLNPPPNTLIRKVGWQDNPWFPSELEELRQHALRTDPDRYDWVWEGHCRKVSEATVFRGRYVIEGFDEPEDVDRYFYGADWGFANDPSVLIRCFIRDETLYITHEAYAVGVEIDDLPALFAGGIAKKTGVEYSGVPGAKDWPIKADSARPETISYIARQGFAISAAEKWPGSVEDGIAHLKGFKQIVVHERCVNTAQEYRLYSYKTDPRQLNPATGLPVILPKLEDKNNHVIDACIAEGELITIARGLVPIEHVMIGDRVLTRKGWRKVTAAWMSGVKPIWELTTAGYNLRATTDHRVFLADGRIARMDEVRPTDEVVCIRKKKPWSGIVRQVRATGVLAQTYDLTVEGEPEFFANGILVHNCRYALSGYIQKRGGLGVWARLL